MSKWVKLVKLTWPKPPATTTSARPARIQSQPAAMAWLPAEQAFARVATGPAIP